jgi:hypothetical protein
MRGDTHGGGLLILTSVVETRTEAAAQ